MSAPTPAAASQGYGSSSSAGGLQGYTPPAPAARQGYQPPAVGGGGGVGGSGEGGPAAKAAVSDPAAMGNVQQREVI